MKDIVKTVELQCSRDHAFDVYTTRIGDWWPRRGYSTFDAESADLVLEPREGGRLYETSRSGEVAEWGSVVLWDPKARFAHTFMAWAGEPRTRVDVTFTERSGGCTVTVVHGEWTDDLEGMYGGYDEGWDAILAGFADETAH